MRIKVFKNNYVSMEKIEHSGFYRVAVYIGTKLHDKIVCDTYSEARVYFKAFPMIAKNN
jgi:hypothetical protein